MAKPKAKKKTSKSAGSKGQSSESKSAKFYTGGMGEHLVMAELLARGFNVARAVVDEGIDVIAFKPQQPRNLFRIQVKAAFSGSATNKARRYTFTVGTAAYEKAAGQDYYLVLVMRDEKADSFVSAVLHSQTFDDLVTDADVGHWTRGKKEYQIVLHLHHDGSLTVKNQGGTDITKKAKNRWDRIK